MTTRKCSYCRSTEHNACNCTSPFLLNYLASLCENYNYILSNIQDCENITTNEAILFANQSFTQFLYQRKKNYNTTLIVLVRNLNLTSRLTQYTTACSLITDYIVSRSQMNYRIPLINYGISIMAEENLMINRISLGVESPDLTYYKYFILNKDAIKIILNNFKQYIQLEVEHVFMMETEDLEDCPICMNKITSLNKVRTDCNHNYCNYCFELMVQHSKTIMTNSTITCALCRTKISKCYKPIISLI